MERRNFLKGALAIFGVAAVGVAASTGAAEAAPLTPKADLPRMPEAEPAAAATTPEADETQGQYYYRRRVYRRAYYRPRRVYYRPRRVYYRRVYRRPVYRVYW